MARTRMTGMKPANRTGVQGERRKPGYQRWRRVGWEEEGEGDIVKGRVRTEWDGRSAVLPVDEGELGAGAGAADCRRHDAVI